MPTDRAALRLAAFTGSLAASGAVLWLVRIPADPKNAIFLGYSTERLALIGFLLAGGAGLLALAFPGRSLLAGWVAPLKHPGWTYAALLFVLSIGTFAGRALTDAPADARAFYIRLLPFLAWLIAAGALAALACGYLAFGPNRRAGAPTPQPGPLLFLLVFSSAWFPRILDLDRFVTVDEPTWFEGAEVFFLSVSRGDFKESHIAEHPAVPLFWAGSFSIRRHLGGETGLADDPSFTPNRLEEYFAKREVSLLDLLATARITLVLLNAAAIAGASVFAAALFGAGPALAGGLLVAFDPFHAGHARLLTMDGLLASLMALSILGFLAHLHTGRRIALVVSGLAAGLAWLTKTPGLFLLPVVGLVGFLHKIGEGRGAALLPRFAGLLRSYAAWALIGAACFFAFFPAMWVAPAETLRDMFTETFLYAAEGHRGPVFYAGQVYADGRIIGVSFALVNFLWRTTPAVLAGLLGLGWVWWTRRISDRRLWLLVLAAILLILLQSAGAKKFDRYFLHAFLLLDFAAGFGLAFMLERINTIGAKASAVTLLAAGLLWPVAGAHPYYLSYYNPLLGGGERAPETMMIGWGEGLDEAGRYLGEKPDADSLSVIAWYNRGSFDYFYPGESRDLPVNDPPAAEELAEILAMDYAVIYVHQWQRDLPANLLAVLADRQPEHSVWIDGIEYVRIYDLQK